MAANLALRQNGSGSRLTIGDFNGDGQVGIDDILTFIDIWESGEVETVGDAIRADVDGDNTVDLSDVERAIEVYEDGGDPSDFKASSRPRGNIPGVAADQTPHMGILITVEGSGDGSSVREGDQLNRLDRKLREIDESNLPEGQSIDRLVKSVL